MIAPMATLEGIDIRLELYLTHLVVRRLSWLAFTFDRADRMLSLRDIAAVRFFPGSALLNGVICIQPVAERGASVYVVFTHQHLCEARAVYEALDNVVHPKDVLPIIRQMQPR